MATTKRTATRQKANLTLRARKLARENGAVVMVLAVIVAVGVTALLTRRVLAAKHQVRVLDCPVAGAVAHHHDDNCFDDEGNLVCLLPERDVHVHDQGCYQRQLVCGKADGEGAHSHDEGCYDEWGNLVCGQDESAGHQHDDSCYADMLACGQEECAEEHVHGDGCWKVVAANEDAVEATHPKQAFQHDVRDKDRKLVLRVDAEAPLGALPAGSTMDVALLDDGKVDAALVQKALDDRVAELKAKAEESKKDKGGLNLFGGEAEAADEDIPEIGKVLKLQAVDVTFRDAEGNEVQPAKEVTLKLTSKLAKTADARSVVRVEDEEEAARRAAEQAHEKSESQGLDAGAAKETGADQGAGDESDAKGKPTLEAHAVDQLSESQMGERQIKLDDDQVAFDADRSTTYVLTTTSLAHEMRATDGSTVAITVNATAEAGIPQDAVLDVSKVGPTEESYDDYLARTVEAMGAERSDVALAQFFDIHIKDGDGNEIRPNAPVDVKIELSDIPDAPNGFAAVHFREVATGGDGGEAVTNTELEQLACGGEGGTVTFAADSFSVYGIVYTVDFGYEVEGQLYECVLPGGGSVGLTELVEALHIYGGSHADVASFMADVQGVSFSDPSLVWVEQVVGRKSVGELLDELDLERQYTAETTDEQKSEWNAREYENDWALLSLKPFMSTEMLTITMADGSQRLVAVTDAQDAPMIPDPNDPGRQIVDTITNPAGTTIDLFDYWVDDSIRNSTAKNAWPGGWNGNSWDNGYTITVEGNSIRLQGQGYNVGINENHYFKFTPSHGGTVTDGPLVNGQQSKNNATSATEHNVGGGVNAYTGNADPLVGLVENRLVDGYPKLTSDDTLGTNGESLAYLFNDNDSTKTGSEYQKGKQTYKGVDHLLYVDEDGYYNYDSADYWADFNADTNTFTLTEQTSGDADIRGFWPFGSQVFWHGMHMNSQFSMPEGGQVLNPKGIKKDMTFEFMGDDDTWLYIDGVLIGDGGGIHNRTDISINYHTGEVVVTGTKDSFCYPANGVDGGHPGVYTQTTTIGQLFRDAGVDTSDASKWVDLNNDGYADTFAPGTYHEFDMYYLERGGGQSNLKIRYNLVSTADFTGHKEYQGSDEDDVLTRDQFKFDLIGIDGEYYYDATDNYALKPAPIAGADARRAIMPKATEGGAGTVASPYFNTNTPVTLSDNTAHGAQTYRTGATEDGNINFGQAEISQALRDQYNNAVDNNQGTKPAYRYMVRESIPNDAVNFYGQPYGERTDEQRAFEKWYTKDGIMYDATIHYMVAEVTRWAKINAVTGLSEGYEYGLSKRYYTDDTFTTPLQDKVFIDFDNRYVKPLTLNIIKESKDDHSQKLSGAEFRLYNCHYDIDADAYVEVPGGHSETVTTNGSGTASFTDLPAGFYYLEETRAPRGFKRPNYKWLVSITRREMYELENGTVIAEADAGSSFDMSQVKRKYSELEAHMQKVNRDGTPIDGELLDLMTLNNFAFTKEVENEVAPPFAFNVEKHWGGIDLADPDDAAAVANSQVVVTLGRYKLADVAGTLSIVKQGVPEGARATIAYKVYDDSDQLVGSYTNSAWTGADVTIASLTLAPGTYTVEETVYSDDSRYTSNHPESGSANKKQVTIVDEGTETASFPSTYTEKRGTIVITTSLTNSTEDPVTIDTSGVSYKVQYEDGSFLSDGQGNPIEYHPTFDNDGHSTITIPDLLVGSYSVIESGWPAIEETKQVHVPTLAADSTSTATHEVTENASTTYEFTTEYQDKPNEIHVIVLGYWYPEGNPSGAGDASLVAEEIVQSNRIRLQFSNDNLADSKPIFGDTKGEDKYSYTTGGNGNTCIVEIDIPTGVEEFTIYAGSTWGSNAFTQHGDFTITGLEPAFGALKVTSMFSESSYTGSDHINPDANGSNVRYYVYAGTDTSANGTLVGECSYAEASGGGGKVFSLLPTGQYTVVERGWPTTYDGQLSHGSDFTVNADGSVQRTLMVSEGETPSAEFAFSTEHGDVQLNPVHLVVYRCSENGGNYQPDESNKLYDNSTSASSVLLTFWVSTPDDPKTVVSRWSNNGVVTDNQSTITMTGTSVDNWSEATASIAIPSENDGTITVFITSGWSNPNHIREDVTVTEIGGSRGFRGVGRMMAATGSISDTAAPRLRRGAPILRAGVNPGTYSTSSSDSGDRPTPAELNKKYVEDTSFTTGNVVTLTADDLNNGIWQELVTGLPADDGQGHRYFYFIQSVSETNLPAGTELTIVKDGTDKMLAFENDDYDEPNHLVARNKVGMSADVSVLKVDANDHDVHVGGAVFHLLTIDGQTETLVSTPTVSPLVSGQNVTFGADGTFTVPTDGALLESLQPGTYKIVEDAPPSGYVMTDPTEFEFTVNPDGTVSQTSGGQVVSPATYVDGSTLVIENTPGSELPHSGGIGSVLVTVAGVGLVAAGTMALVLKRRRAHAEVGQHARRS